MNKLYIGVEEAVEPTGTVWGVVLGSPNPDQEHYIELPKEKAFEVERKLKSFLNEYE